MQHREPSGCLLSHQHRNLVVKFKTLLDIISETNSTVCCHNKTTYKFIFLKGNNSTGVKDTVLSEILKNKVLIIDEVIIALMIVQS